MVRLLIENFAQAISNFEEAGLFVAGINCEFFIVGAGGGEKKEED
jgi:hypothetical protein